MTTQWLFRCYLFIRSVDATTANKNLFASIFVDGGSLETAANELKMFLNPVKLSTTGALPAQAFGFNFPAKASMKDGFIALMSTLTNARYGIVRHNDLGLVATNFTGITPTGQVVTWETALQRVQADFGLIVIPPAGGL